MIDDVEVVRRSRRGASRYSVALLAVPAIVVLLLFGLIPLALIVVGGFQVPGGGVGFENFSRMFSTDTFVLLAVRTIGTAALVTVFAIAIGWPAAWAIARCVRSPRLRGLILGLVIIPYITSQILLIYGFYTLIQPSGPLSTAANWVGFPPGGSILFTPIATFIMLVYESIPTAILVLYAASERLDSSLLEASRSLGAGRLRTFGRVIWPLCAPLVVVNFSMTFVQTVGAFAEPQILGGPSGQLYGNAISQYLATSAGRPFAIALSLVLLVLSLLVIGVVAAAVRLSVRTTRSGKPPLGGETSANDRELTGREAVEHAPIAAGL